MEATDAHKALGRSMQEMSPADKAEHLLRVVASVNRDASDAWSQLWGEFKPHVSSSGAALPSIQEGFVPACGWTEFFERMWLLKHFLDSTGRICQGKH